MNETTVRPPIPPLPPEECLAHVRACSPFVANLLDRYPDWRAALDDAGRLGEGAQAPDAATLEALASEVGLEPALRRYRNREMLRIIWRDLCGLAPLRETLADLTTLAEVCLEVALAQQEAVLAERHGVPRDAAGARQRLVVIGMGKLGGRELNLSSDIDIMLAFRAHGTTDGRRRLPNEQYFVRLTRALVKSLSEVTADGFCFRVDTRLRPFGDSGPLCCSFGAMEQYYQREGRDWERYAMIKARPVAGDRVAGAELLETLRPFVYRRYIDYGAVEALREMRQNVADDAARKDRLDDVKRGPGGIREIEFLVQGFQLLRGGREARLQTVSLHRALEALPALGLLDDATVRGIAEDYRFLRDVENRIQAQRDQQTHSIPRGEDFDRLVAAMRYGDGGALREDIDAVRGRVRATFDACFPAQPQDSTRGETRSRWRGLVEGEDLAPEGQPLADFVRRLRRQALSQRAAERMNRFMPVLLERLETLALDEATEDDVFELVLAVCRRSAYLALLMHNPAALDRMLNLFATSDWIARRVIRFPALLDELIDPALGRVVPGREVMDRIVARILETQPDPEAALSHLNHTRRAFTLRIAVAELEMTLTGREVQAALTALAEAVLGAALTLARDEIERRHGTLADSPLAVIGYGTLGAGELGYGSDLDLVFLYPATDALSNGPRPLSAEQYHTRLARRLLGFLTAPTPAGRLYEVDMRLRPNGRAGLLVSSLTAFEKYQAAEAWTWELQALARARPIAGDTGVAARFGEIRRDVLCQPRDRASVRAEVGEMREKLRAARSADRGTADPFKDVRGGLVDIEFLAQSGVLESAGADETVIEAADTLGQLRALRAAAWLDAAEEQTLAAAHERLTRGRHFAALRREAPEPVEGLDAVAAICARYFGD